MPNLWTKSTQKLSEAFSGPRTKDLEFDKKVEELKIIEKGLVDLRNTFKNFQIMTSGIANICKEIKGSIKSIYKSSHYETFGDCVLNFHDNIETHYNEMITNVNNVYNKTSEWMADFKTVKDLIEKRNQCRKDYDHYEEKMEKMYKSKDEKIRKGDIINAKDQEFYERVSKINKNK